MGYCGWLICLLRFSFSDVLIEAYFALVEKLVSGGPHYRGKGGLFWSTVSSRSEELPVCQRSPDPTHSFGT